MKLAQAIYRLAKLKRLLDVDGCQEDVEALHMAVEVLTDKLKAEQVDVAVKTVMRFTKHSKAKEVV
jgi:hypothetical protein